MKKMYVKPTIKTVEWDFQNPVCSTVYQQSSCVHVTGDENGASHIDHRQSWDDSEIHWNNWGE